MTDPTLRGAQPVVVSEPRRRSKIGLLLGLLLLIVVAAIVVAVVLASWNNDEAKNDVKVTTCQGSAGGGKPKAAGTITNHSSKTSNYVVKISFKDADGNGVGEVPPRSKASTRTSRRPGSSRVTAMPRDRSVAR